MAQSSDSNDSIHDDESDSYEAKQILDSIIGHIEMSDGSENNQHAESNDHLDAEPSADDVEKRAGQAKPDFSALEKRAAELANKLGGAGLSYNAGAKVYLSDEEDTDVSGLDEPTSEIDASIHIEDMEMESLVIDVPHEGQANDVAAEFDAISEEQYHVSEWEADTHRERNEDAASMTSQDAIVENPAQEEIDVDQTDDGHPIEQDGTYQDYSVENQASAVEPGQDVVFLEDGPAEEEGYDTKESASIISGQGKNTDLDIADIRYFKEEASDAAPELGEIEQQIEALSVSMKEVDVENTEQEASGLNLQETRSVESMDVSGEVSDRVASLEKQIVDLLGQTTRSDEQLRETVAQVMRDETQNAVQEALASSDLVVNLKSEIASSAEQRNLQDSRMADSLDALHDALKDIGERVSAVENASIPTQLATGGDQHGLGGVASSVLGAQLKALTITPHNEEQEPVQNEIEAPKEPSIAVSSEAELPTWLEDSTHDLHQHEESDEVVQADVFAVAPETPTIATQSVEVENALQEEPQTNLSELQPSTVQKIPESELPVVNTAMQNGQSVVEPVDEVEEPHVKSEEEPVNAGENYVPRKQAEKVENKGNSFLQAARMAARAANERASQIEEQSDKSRSGRAAEVKRSNFIAAAKQKQRDKEEPQKPLASSAKRPAKNSLFSDKTEGPNSLLVFTSLILFGTSALLLYGMSKNGDESGSVAKLNAVEQKQVDGQSAPEIKADKRKLAVPGKNASGKTKSKLKRRVGKRSRLDKEASETGRKLALVKGQGTLSGRDTLTNFDKIVADRLATNTPVPSSVEFTGAIPDRTRQEKSGSLFEEYISFSGLSKKENRPAGTRLPVMVHSDKNLTEEGGAKRLLMVASGGDAQAQYEVARRYGKGIGVKKSPAISVEWYEKSAKAGYAPAIYRLATMYERGNGVTKNYQRAMELYLSAAQKGNVKSMHNLAVLFTGGNLGKADYRNAIKWYEKAANYGIRDSQFNLAIIYQNGMGGTQNMEKAYKWYTLASRSGDDEAKDLLIDVREELNATQLRKMDRELGDWKAKIPDVNANSAKQYSGTMGQTKVAGR